MPGQIDSVIFNEIEKGGGDLAYFSKYARATVQGQVPAAWETRYAVNSDLPATAGGIRPPTPNNWSTIAETGCNQYLFRVTTQTRAIFKSVPSEVICYSPHITGASLISSVRLIANNCVSFVVDTNDVIDAVKQTDSRGNLGYGKGEYVSLPLFFNLYDTTHDLPVWLLSADHSHTPLARSHGGVHLGGFVSHMFVELV